MTDLDSTRPDVRALPPDRVSHRDSLDRAMLETAASAARLRSCHHLDHVPLAGRHPELSGPLRTTVLAGAAWNDAVPTEDAGLIDADAVARWIVKHYPSRYPAVVLGSPHGGAVHLAAALGAPWLPTGFTVKLRWPGGSVDDWGAAMEHGAVLAERIMAANPTVSVRQVHDPFGDGPLCAFTVTLHVRWRHLPPAYRSFVDDALEPGAPAVLLRDVRTWPIVEVSAGHSFQVGSPVSGRQPGDYTTDNPLFAELATGSGRGHWQDPYPRTSRRYAEPAGEPEFERHLRETAVGTGHPSHRVLYPTPERLSACVADLYRQWLRRVRRPADGCVVESGRLLDPWQVLTTGLVPYWCESASRTAVTAAEWWMAGSPRFDSVDVLPAPPGSGGEGHAEVTQWESVAAFARHRGSVSHEAARRYPRLPLPTSHASAMLRSRPGRRCVPLRLRMADVLGGLRRSGQDNGLLVL